METSFSAAVKARRSYYGINNEQVTGDERIHELVGEMVTHLPSPFNSQSSRVVILLGQQHDRLWDLTKAELQKLVPEENFPATAEKINNCFRSGYGTLLYFEDQTVVQGLQQAFPAYGDNFPVWSQHASAMLQFAIWTALEQDGWGASLQHYNPVIDVAVAAAWDIPSNWKLIAQMPFGKPVAQPGPKEVQPLTERVKLYR